MCLFNESTILLTLHSLLVKSSKGSLRYVLLTIYDCQVQNEMQTWFTKPMYRLCATEFHRSVWQYANKYTIKLFANCMLIYIIITNTYTHNKLKIHFYPFPAYHYYTNSTEREVDRILSVKYEDGRWSKPYYDCGGGNIWMLTYTVPFFGYDNGSYHFK